MTDRELWAEIASRYGRAWGPNLLAVASYGSRARGQGAQGSDHDILVLAERLDVDPFERSRAVRGPLRGLRQAAEVHVLSRTRDEFFKDVTPLHLDLALDAVVLLDTDGTLTASLEKLRERIAEAGLERDPDLFWSFTTQPSSVDWAIDWDAVRV